MEKPNSSEGNLNPWDVTSYQDFLFYNCPECQFKVKNQIEFHQHAIENHVKALNLSWKLYSKRPNTDQRKYDMIRKKAVVCKQCDTRCSSLNGLRLHIQSAKCQNVEPMTITGESDFDETQIELESSTTQDNSEISPNVSLGEDESINDTECEANVKSEFPQSLNIEPEPKLPKIIESFHIPSKELKPEPKEQEVNETLKEFQAANQSLQLIQIPTQPVIQPNMTIYKRDGKMLCPEYETCDETFDDLNDLVNHLQTHFTPVLPTLTVHKVNGRMTCPYHETCDLTFDNYDSLMEHVAQHTNQVKVDAKPLETLEESIQRRNLQYMNQLFGENDNVSEVNTAHPLNI